MFTRLARCHSFTYVVPFMLLTVAAGVVTAMASQPLTAHAISYDWTSCLTDEVVEDLNESHFSSCAIRWLDWEACGDCYETTEDPTEHMLTLGLDTTYVPSCGLTPASYLSSLYLNFCASMGSQTFGTKLGTVKWFQGQTQLATRDLIYFSEYVGYSVLTCFYGLTYPDKLMIAWGATGPARGNAAKGYDVLVTCCNC